MVVLKDSVVEILKAVTDAIINHENVSTILNKTVTLICQKLIVECCSIYTYDRQEGNLVLVATEGLEKAIGYKISTDRGITGHVFKTRRQINIANPDKHPEFVLFENSGEEKFHSYMGIPMMAGNSCVGVLVIQSCKARKFHEDIADLAVSLSSQLAIVVANADIEKIFQDHSEQQVLSETSELGNQDLLIEGVSISGGTVYSPIFMLQSDDYWNDIEIRYIENRPKEQKKLKAAVKKAIRETIEIQERASKVFIEADASIFFAQLLFLEDPNFVSDIEHGIDFHGMDAASSVKVTVEKYIDKFKASKDTQLMERCMDLMDIGLRIIQYLLDSKEYPRPNDNQRMIFVGDDIMPSDLMRVSSDNILGIACALGGSTSHTAILARSLGIPAVMGLEGVKDICRTGDKMLIDGEDGRIILNPSPATLKAYDVKLNQCQLEIFNDDLSEPTITADNKRIQVMGNICMVSDMNSLKKYQNDGVGLYRTEFMYMIHETFPSENEQYRIFRSIAKMAHPNKVTVRALDIGGDKPLKYFDCNEESDPMLGFRSLRILLEHREIFEPHMRAMLRAGQRGNIKILFPMVAHYEDIVAVKQILSEILEDLNNWYGKKFKMPEIGAMVEMPSTVWQIEEILKEVDFVSIGTNDLVQYIFAVDRGNSKVSEYFKPMHPVVLKTLKHIVDCSKKQNKPVSLCGEIAGNPIFIPILLGLGLTELSMPPMMIPKIKPIICKLDVVECKNLVKKVLKLKTEVEVQEKVKKFIEKSAIKLV
ncbi:MAG: phosphoenolpyruvate--protein phosphotransferase [Lentisphaeraceae bacterium]|nr:phosphoenolpyruvate--protein phosphotransferase [Lentisphaeraceae bacterium]